MPFDPSDFDIPSPIQGDKVKASKTFEQTRSGMFAPVDTASHSIAPASVRRKTTPVLPNAPVVWGDLSGALTIGIAPPKGVGGPWNGVDRSIVEVGVNVAVDNALPSDIRIGIYHNPTALDPGAGADLIYDSGVLSITALGANVFSVPGVAIPNGGFVFVLVKSDESVQLEYEETGNTDVTEHYNYSGLSSDPDVAFTDPGSAPNIQQTPRGAAVWFVHTSTPASEPEEPSGLPPDVQFRSSWSTALGTSDAAVRDTGRDRPWPTVGGAFTGAVVASGGDFPSDNCLDVEEFDGALVIRASDAYWPAMAAGQYMTWRFHMIMDNGGNYDAALNTAIEGPGDQWFPSAVLLEGVEYEFQVRLRMVGGITYELDTIIYEDPQGARTEVVSTPDFENWNQALQFLDGYVFSDHTQDQIDFLGGLTLSFEETLAGGASHPFYPIEAYGTGNFPTAPFAWHFWSATPGDNGTEQLRMSCVTVCAGDIVDSEFPLRRWTSAEEIDA